jgi:hypothetical protein
VSFSAFSQIAMRLNRNIETLAQNAKISDQIRGTCTACRLLVISACNLAERDRSPRETDPDNPNEQQDATQLHHMDAR